MEYFSSRHLLKEQQQKTSYMRRYWVVLITLLFSFSMNAQNPGWEKVKQLESESLPASALEVTKQIYQDALKRGDSPEVIKSLIYRIKFETAINGERLPDLIEEVEKYAGESKNQAEQSVIYSLLARIYLNYYNSESYKINQRTSVAGHVPEDIREWSKNNFTDRIGELVALSLQPASILQQTQTTDYEAILVEGSSSRTLRPTLFDFLSYEGIDILNGLQWQFDFGKEIDRMYLDLIAFREKEGNSQALLMARLDQLQSIYHRSQSETREESYLKALEELKKGYSDKLFCAEILYREANFYFQKRRYDTNSAESVSDLQKVYDICTEGIRKYPDYERIGILQNLLSQLTAGSLTVKSDNTVYPGSDLKLAIRYKNFDKLTVKIYRIHAPSGIYPNRWNRQGLYKERGEVIDTKEVLLNNASSFQMQDTTISIPMKELGNYEYVIYGDDHQEKPTNKQFSVSRLASLSRSLRSNREFLVTDRFSGKPVEGAEVVIFRRKESMNEVIKRVKTDHLGLALFDGKENYSGYSVVFGNDTALTVSQLPYMHGEYSPDEDDQIALSLFTDRSIYRPGQTVYFKGIVFRNDAERQQVIARRKITISLMDVNYEEVATKEFVSNEFGSIAGEFTLPQGGLTGYFSLRSGDETGFTSFQVEEYKRPSFDIRFKENTRTYAFGDEIVVEGEAKAFSGVLIGDQKATYRITRSNLWPFFRIYAPPVQIAEGSVTTDDTGSFRISFPAEKRFEDKESDNIFYSYTVDVTLTDSKGETQNAQTSLFVGDKSMMLAFDGFSSSVVMERENLPKLRINAMNLSSNQVEATGNYEIFTLKGDKTEISEDFDMEDWENDKLVLSGTFTAGGELDGKKIGKLASGAYRIIARSKDDRNRDIEAQHDFLLASPKDKRPPVKIHQWIMTPKTSCAVGENAEIIYGSSVKNAYVLYELFQDQQKIATSRFELNNENRKIEIPFLQSYGNGVSATFTFIKEGKVYTKSVNIEKKQPDRELVLKTEVFRDRLLPGQSEEWKVSVKDKEGLPASAELLAGMYDASLDKIAGKYFWHFNPVPPVYLSAPGLNTGSDFGFSSASTYLRAESKEVPTFQYDSFNWFDWDIRNRMLTGSGGMRIRGKSALNEEGSANYKADSIDDALTEAVAGISVSESVVQEITTVQDQIPPSSTPAPEAQAVSPRTNFNETAFFYPQLKTNAEGETLISFILPESNTTWKFMTLAHTQDLHHGTLTREIISQKKLMVSPNIPRFAREGDRMSLAADISNLSDESLSGIIRIEFFDPVTEKTTITVAEESFDFTVEPGKTRTVSWIFTVPSGIDLTAVKIIAQTDTYSDGEQHLIPVFPNRMLVTESLAMNVQGGQSRQFRFDKLADNTSATLEDYKLTLEFTENPLWYAVQALPAMTTPQSDDVISWFAAYYSNTLAAYIANNTPRIGQVIEAWTKQGGDKNTLLSALEKNQELKALLLEETPWVMQAGNESEQKQRLALLFDVNRTKNLSDQALDKLTSLQQWDGGWSWFNGMGSSVSITHWLLYGMKEMERQGAVSPDDQIKTMQENALKYIDTKFREYFEQVKKYNTKWKEITSLSTYEIEYLYIRSLYREIPLSGSQEAAEFYTSVAERYWAKNTGLYTRSLIALTANRNGNRTVASAILKSLREHAVRKPDLGMYWANNNTHTFMFQSAATIHTFIMSAFLEIDPRQGELDEMKLWLLKQKQTQEWESVPATVNAVNILLQSGSDWLSSGGKVNVSAGGKTMTPASKEPATGYFKREIDTGVVRSAKGVVEVRKEDAGPAWGALYWQYFEELDKITSATTELNVEKSLFIEKNSSSGRILTPVTEATPLTVGDKVTVRLTVRTDRDMEYVLLKDMRASCFEQTDQLSETRWKEGILYYYAPKDASVNFYFHNLAKGTYVFEYQLYVQSSGDYSNGITTIQCLYAPEFVSHTSGGRVTVSPRP